MDPPTIDRLSYRDNCPLEHLKILRYHRTTNFFYSNEASKLKYKILLWLLLSIKFLIKQLSVLQTDIKKKIK